MGHDKKLRIAVILVTIVVNGFVVNAGDKCRSGCQGVTPNVYKYAEGVTYKYSLDGNVEVALSGAEQQQTSAKLKATVLLTPLSDCNQLVRLQGVQISGPDGKKYGSMSDLQKGVRFVFHDGHVEDEICTEPGDSQASLNVKRAVISLFQAATKNSKEIDVFGECPTEFSTYKEGGGLVIRKTRDLNRCAFRESLKQDFIATSFNQDSAIKSTPLLNGDYSSEQKIKNGILDRAEIVEHYLYKPFSNGNNGAKATVTTKLQFVGQSQDAAKPKTSEPKSIIFENPHITNVPTSNVDNLLSSLKKALETSASEQYVQPGSAQAYRDLVSTFRITAKDDILTVYGQVKTGAGFKNKVAAKNVFLEALYRAGTGDTIEVAIKLLKSKEIPAEHYRLLFLGLAFVKHASSESLGAAASLLDQPNLPREAYLGIGTLAKRYCSEHKCEKDNNLNKLTVKFISKLGTCTATNRKEEDDVVAILKGLGNFHTLSESILDKLIHCASDKKISTRIRVAALEAFHADTGKLKLRQAAIEILKDREEDSEIRIKAYLAMVSHPCPHVAHALKDLLATEPVNQVGSFIVSHLRNARSSANPDKQAIKQQLGLLRSAKRYPFDIRRFSFNSELSYAIDSLGLGTYIESNVIYSQNSFLPRSTNFNLTGQVFGHTFNFFEIGARQENLDRLLEHYVGPKGVIRPHYPLSLLEKENSRLQEIINKVKARFEKSKRGRREVGKADIENFAKHINLGTYIKDNELDIDLSLKVFGSELGFISIHDDIAKFSPESFIDKAFAYFDSGVNSAKHFSYDVKPHTLFLDTEVAYPTSVGIPLKLGVVGASSVAISAKGDIDIKKIMNDPHNAEIHFSFVPSANIEFVGKLYVDAYQVQTGLQVVTNMHTSTGSDVTVKLINGKGIDLKVGLPIKEQDLITINHQLIFATKELGHPTVEVPLKFHGNRREYKGCFDQVSQLIGLTFCGEIAVPVNIPGITVGAANANLAGTHFPLNGPAKVSVKIERDDLKEYHIKTLLQDESPHYKKFELTFETPGSKTDRKVSILLEGQLQPEKFVKATLISPIKSIVVEGRVVDTANEKSLSVLFAHDKQEFSGKIGVTVQGNDAKAKYTPLIEYNTPDTKHKGLDKGGYGVEGAIVVEKSGDSVKYSFDNVKIFAPNFPPVLIKGSVGKAGQSFVSDVKVSQDKYEGSLKGKVEIISPRDIKIDAEVTNTINPNLNFHLILEHQRSDGTFENKLILNHGLDLKSPNQKLVLENSAHYKYENVKSFDISFKNKLSYPVLHISGNAEGKLTPNTIKYDFEGTYDKANFKNELDAKVNQKHPGDYDVEFEAKAFNNIFKAEAKRDIIGDNKSKFSNSLQIQDKKYSIDGTAEHRFLTNDIDAKLDAVAKVAGRPEPVKIDIALVMNPQQVDTHAKVLDGSNPVVDFFFKGNRAGNADGKIKLTVGPIVDANGEVHIKSGKGSGFILFDFKKINKKVKAESQFTIAAPTFNGIFNLHLDFEKDPTKKIYLSTTNKVTKTSVDSKNVFEISTYKTELNFNGNHEGKFDDGKQNGFFELILPTEHYFTGKIDREVHNVDQVYSGKIVSDFEYKVNKNSRGSKIHYDGVVKDYNPKQNLLDNAVYNIILENSEGKDVKFNINGKRDAKNAVLGFKLHGSYVPEPLEYNSASTYASPKSGSYQATAKYGAKTSLALKGDYDYGAATPGKYHHDNELQLNIPNEKYKTILIKMNGKLKKPQTEDDVFEYTVGNSITLNNEKSLKFDGSVRGNKNQGSGKVSLALADDEPMTLSATYKKEEQSSQLTVEVEHFKKDNKNLKLTLTASKVGEDQVTIHLVGQTPNDQLKTVDLLFKNKRSNGGKAINSELVMTANGKKYTATNEVIISESSPAFDLEVVNPEGKKSRLAAKFNKISEEKYSGEVHIVNIKDFNLEASGEANLESVDNFLIKIDIDSANLKLEKVHVEILNKPAKSGKRIQFTAKSGANNLISGSTTYRAKEEAGKLIIEGSGQVKVKEEQKAASFKFIKNNLVLDKDGQRGIEVTFNGALGGENVVGELHVSDKQFKVLTSYCEESKQCAHIEIDSKTKNADFNEFNHELQVAVDLRKLGIPNEFGLKSVYARKQFDIDHVIDVHYHATQKYAYQYKLYVHPKSAGLTLTLPKRTILIAGEVSIPKAGKKSSPAKLDLVVYLDKKNRPDEKTAFSAKADLVRTDTSIKADGEVKFIHPALGKDLILKGEASADKQTYTADVNVEIDIFAKKNQKLTIVGKAVANPIGGPETKGFNVTSDLKIESKGLGLQIFVEEHAAVAPQDVSVGASISYKDQQYSRQSKVLFVVNEKQFIAVVKIPNAELVHIESNYQLNKNLMKATSKIRLYGFAPLTEEVELKDESSFKYVIYKDAEPQKKLYIESELIYTKHAYVKAEIQGGGAPQNLYHSKVLLDQGNFLKYEYGVSTENMNKVIEYVRKDFQNAFEQYKTLVDTIQKDVKSEITHFQEQVKKATPNFKPVVEAYKKELKIIQEEIVSDETFKQVSEFMQKYFGAFITAAAEFLQKLGELIEKLQHIFVEHYSKVCDTITKEIYPKIEESVSKIFHVLINIAQQITQVIFIYVSKVAEVFKAYEADFKQIADAFGEYTSEFGKQLTKSFAVVHTELTNLVAAVIEQIKALPVTEIIREKYKELTHGLDISEQILNVLTEITNTVKQAMPTPELQEFIGASFEYVEKKLQRKPVDEAEALKKIYGSFLRAVQSLVKFFQEQAGGKIQNYQDAFNIQSLPLASLSTSFYRIPAILSVRFSPLRFLLQDDLPSLIELFYTYKPTSFDPMRYIPPYELDALIVDGQHIFTFDRKHLTFPGDCEYILAQDGLDGNFTLTASLSKGHLHSLTLTDDHDSVTIKNDGTVYHNGAPTEFSVRSKQIQAWKLYESVNIYGYQGVMVNCQPDLRLCGVRISGFYRGRLRGLFGNGNDESYDDFVLPEGKIVASEDQFGNAYKLTGSCPLAKTPNHDIGHHSSSPVCADLFSSSSNFKFCFPYYDPHNFRVACEHAVQAGQKDVPCLLAKAYHIVCKTNLIPTTLPDQCVQCDAGDVPLKSGEFKTVTSPTNQADVIFVVEQLQNNEAVYKELVSPLVQQLTADFKGKGITDVHFALIGHGVDRYPNVFTTNGKIQFTGQNDHVKFSTYKKPELIKTGCEKVDDFIEKLYAVKIVARNQLGLSSVKMAYDEARRYPFRPNAVRTVIGVPAQRCVKSFPVDLITGRLIIDFLNYKRLGATFNVITPLEDIKVVGKDSKIAKTIVGFSSHAAYTFSDAKKKSEGSPELKKSIDHDSDFCVDFALRTGGAAFSSATFLSSKGGQRKQFSQVVSNAIVNQLVGVEQQRQCFCYAPCSYAQGTYPKTECYVTSSHDREITKKGVKG